jgi:hypothetical protein
MSICDENKPMLIEELLNEKELNFLKTELKIELKFDTYTHPNEGANDGKIIFVNKYSTKELALLIIFHEYGHLIYDKRAQENRIYSNSKMFSESVAWYEGMLKLREIEHVFGVYLDLDKYSGKANTYIRECLKSYQNSEYNELGR